MRVIGSYKDCADIRAILEGGHDLPILRQEVSGRLDFVAFAVERAQSFSSPL